MNRDHYFQGLKKTQARSVPVNRAGLLICMMGLPQRLDPDAVLDVIRHATVQPEQEEAT